MEWELEAWSKLNAIENKSKESVFDGPIEWEELVFVRCEYVDQIDHSIFHIE